MSWHDELPEEMADYLETLPQLDEPVQLRNWSDMYGVHWSTVREHLKRHHPGLLEWYQERRRNWEAQVDREIQRLGAFSSANIRQVCAKFGTTWHKAIHRFELAEQAGLFKRKYKKPAARWANVVRCARIGMTRRELAEACGIPVGTIAYVMITCKSPYTQPFRECVKWARKHGNGAPLRIVEILPLPEGTP